MNTTLRPHDLIWLNARDALDGIIESWVDDVWHSGLPVVVRRDVDAQGRVPVGVRGMKRDQRAAGWAKPDSITRVLYAGIAGRRADVIVLALSLSATASGGFTAGTADVAVDVGDNREYRLRAADRDPGYPRGKRSWTC
ncbi:phosphoribosyl-dephospho-CoA transferase [Salmonella enterica subsp. arizonae]|nr:phosphoribosyl-dephospho-CoA transferase [Salmonella enterica subsp. arizonae]